MARPAKVPIKPAGDSRVEVPAEIPVEIRVSGDEGERLIEGIARELEAAPKALPTRVDVNPEQVEEGLARLVLTLINLLRRLLENQAIHRMDRGALTDEQIERMSEAFWKLDGKLHELCAQFGLKEEDLGIHLGPIEDLL